MYPNIRRVFAPILILACASIGRATAQGTTVVYTQTQSTVNGAAFLPKGIYAANPGDFARVASYGYNIVQSYQLTGMTDSEVTNYMSQAQQNGLKVLFNLGAAKPTPDVVTKVKARVQMFKDHPAMYAWYLADEPYAATTNHADLKSLYDWIKQNDPNHPVFSSNWELGTFKDCCDVDMPQLYSGAPSRQRTSALPGLERSRAQNGEPWIAIANSYEGFVNGADSLSPATLYSKNPDGSYKFGTKAEIDAKVEAIRANLANPPFPDPPALTNTPAEVRGQAFDMLAHGSNGLYYWLLQPEDSINTTWGYYSIYPRQPLREMMTATMHELDELWPRISAPAQNSSTWYEAESGNVFFWYRRQGSQITVIAVNESENTYQVRAPIPSLSKNPPINAVVSRENRSVTIQDGFLSDTFQPNEAHVYLIDNAGPDSDTDGVWANAAGGSWQTITNWSGNTMANGMGKTADFSTLDIAADTTVSLDGNPVVSTLKFGDTTATHNWTINTGGGGLLTLAGSAIIDVANRTTTIGAEITGQGFQKTGSGALILSGANTYKSGTTVAAGSVTVSGDQSAANGGWTIKSNSIVNVQNGATVAVASGKSIDLANTSGSPHSLNVAGTVTSAGTLSMGGESTVTINSGGNWTQSGAVSLVPNWSYATARITVNGGGTFTYNGTSTIALKSSNAQSGVTDKSVVTLSGGTFVTGQGFNNPIVGGAGSASLEFSGGGTLKLTGDIAALATTADRPFYVNVGTGGGVIDTNGFSTTVTQGITNLSGQTGSLTKQGAGVLTLTGASAYTGTTTVESGTLAVTGSLGNGAVTIQNPATLGGSGTIGGAVTNNGTIAPGNAAAGTLTVNNTVTLANSSTLNWEISDWAGTAGTGWDKLTATSLDITATSANPIVIRLTDVAIANFTETNASFVIAQTTSGITGFSADKFTVNTSGLTMPRGIWAVQQSGNNLVLAYTAQTNPDANSNGILDSWEIAKFGNANPGANPANGDPDNDGLSNLMEYALDTHPATRNTSPIAYDLETRGDGKHLRITVPKNPAATNLTYIVETSSSLNDWSALDTTIESGTEPPLIVRDNFTTTNAARRFIRLKVSSASP